MTDLAEDKKGTGTATLLRLAEVLTRCGQSKSSLYRAVQLGTFPKPVQTPSGPRWRVRDLETWEDALRV